MTEVRVSLVIWETGEDKKPVAVNYTSTWQNFVEDCDMNIISTRRKLREEYNAYPEGNAIVFATDADAVRFILRYT